MIKGLKPSDIDVVVLCGGKGRRLRSVVGDRPKPLADINGRPFLDVLVDHVSAFGFRRFILCTGYMGSAVKKYYAEKQDLDIIISHEEKPLGTAGALKKAERLIKSDPFLLMNGDSICKAALPKLLAFHRKKGAEFSMVITRPEKGSDYGSVSIDNLGKITLFREKESAVRGTLMNAGIYLLERKIFSRIPSGKKRSLEKEVFPALAGGNFYGYITKAKLIDIGTPDRYARARRLFRR